MRQAAFRVPPPGPFSLDLRRLSRTVSTDRSRIGGDNMVVKVQNRSRGPDTAASGLYRRPRLVMQAKRAEEIPAILANTKNYPTPVRFVGADYSQTRCVGGDGGTTVNTAGLDRILEFDENSVRAQAGVRVSTLVRALAERGLELPLTPEMGQISLGAVAVTTLPQSSYGES